MESKRATHINGDNKKLTGGLEEAIYCTTFRNFYQQKNIRNKVSFVPRQNAHHVSKRKKKGP